MLRLAKFITVLTLLGAVLVTLPGQDGWAQSLDSLRASGQVGERFDGYLEARDGSQQGTVNQINDQRRQKFENIASQQGISVDEVSRIAAQKIIGRLPSGAWFLTAGGQWQQR